RPRPAAVLGDGGSLRLARAALRGLAHARPAPAAGRDAGARAGRPAALEAPWFPGPRDLAGDVRLQRGQVADEDGVRRQAATRLLGTARIRPGRLGRTLERLRHLRCAACRGSAAPSARSTGYTRVP